MIPPAWAAPYVGLPYRERGDTRDGVDCWGLCRLVWRERFGLDVPDHGAPAWVEGELDRVGQAAAAAVAQATDFVEVPLALARAGDGLLIRLGRHPAHCGLVVDRGLMIHAEAALGSCVERLDHWSWRSRVLSAHRPLALAGADAPP